MEEFLLERERNQPGIGWGILAIARRKWSQINEKTRIVVAQTDLGKLMCPYPRSMTEDYDLTNPDEPTMAEERIVLEAVENYSALVPLAHFVKAIGYGPITDTVAVRYR